MSKMTPDLDEPVHIVPYDPAWAVLGRALVEQLTTGLRGVDRYAEVEHIGSTSVPGREYLRRRSGQPANVHVVGLRGRLWADNLLFRHHLRAHPEAAAQYARAKRDAAGATGRLLAYSEHKAATVAELMAAARASRASRV
ncbi:GrpB family protein [Kitasatospora sp. NPDC048194]|uniref:GrpB family protein n=1 Tax=Kitasatospora sp. NPDC048194 TaxID=3364045 RepID=UPI0037150A1B